MGVSFRWCVEAGSRKWRCVGRDKKEPSILLRWERTRNVSGEKEERTREGKREKNKGEPGRDIATPRPDCPPLFIELNALTTRPCNCQRERAGRLRNFARIVPLFPRFNGTFYSKDPGISLRSRVPSSRRPRARCVFLGLILSGDDASRWGLRLCHDSLIQRGSFRLWKLLQGGVACAHCFLRTSRGDSWKHGRGAKLKTKKPTVFIQYRLFQHNQLVFIETVSRTICVLPSPLTNNKTAYGKRPRRFLGVILIVNKFALCAQVSET